MKTSSIGFARDAMSTPRVNAITTMITQGEKQLRAVMIAAERDRLHTLRSLHGLDFSRFGSNSYEEIGWQKKEGDPIEMLTAGELMPHYPH